MKKIDSILFATQFTISASTQFIKKLTSGNPEKNDFSSERSIRINQTVNPKEN